MSSRGCRVCRASRSFSERLAVIFLSECFSASLMLLWNTLRHASTSGDTVPSGGCQRECRRKSVWPRADSCREPSICFSAKFAELCSHEEALRQLSDGKFYTKLDGDPTFQYNEKVHKVVKSLEARGVINSKTAADLIETKPRTSHFYTLPKIHRRKDNSPGRPIVSSNRSPTERISAFVGLLLKPLVVSTPSYIRETQKISSGDYSIYHHYHQMHCSLPWTLWVCIKNIPH